MQEHKKYIYSIILNIYSFYKYLTTVAIHQIIVVCFWLTWSIGDLGVSILQSSLPSKFLHFKSSRKIKFDAKTTKNIVHFEINLPTCNKHRFKRIKVMKKLDHTPNSNLYTMLNFKLINCSLKTQCSMYQILNIRSLIYIKTFTWI